MAMTDKKNLPGWAKHGGRSFHQMGIDNLPEWVRMHLGNDGVVHVGLEKERTSGSCRGDDRSGENGGSSSGNTGSGLDKEEDEEEGRADGGSGAMADGDDEMAATAIRRQIFYDDTFIPFQHKPKEKFKRSCFDQFYFRTK